MEVGEDPRKEEANGRGRTGSCRRPADHGRGICFRSPTWGNGGLETLQPNAPLDRGDLLPMDADVAPPCRPVILLRVYSAWKSTYFFQLINFAHIFLQTVLFSFFYLGI